MKIFNTFGQLAAAKVLTGTPVRVLEPALIDGVVEATGEGLSLLSGNVFVPSFGDQESITARKTSLLDDAFTGGISAYLNTYKKDNSGNWVEASTGRTSAVFYAGQVWWPLAEIPYTPGGYLVTGWSLPTGNPDILEVTTSIGTVFQFNRFTGLVDGGNSGGSTVSDTPPVNPLAGNRWTRCSDMKSFIWYVDNDGAQWVEDNPSMGGAEGSTPKYSISSLEGWTKDLLSKSGITPGATAEYIGNSQRNDALSMLAFSSANNVSISRIEYLQIGDVLANKDYFLYGGKYYFFNRPISGTVQNVITRSSSIAIVINSIEYEASEVPNTSSITTYPYYKNGYDVFLVYGQSNAVGYAGNTDGVPENLFNNLYWDYNTQTLLRLKSGIKSSSGETSTGHAWLAFSNNYTKLTGRKCIIIPCARGGTKISDLSKGAGTGYYEAMASSVANFETYVLANNIVVNRTSLLFHQGETDMSTGTTHNTYISLFDVLLNNIRSDFGVDKCFIARVGCPQNRTEMSWYAIQTAQDYLTQSYDWVIMAYTGCGSFTKGNGLLWTDGVHYTQYGYNAMGDGMAVTVANSLDSPSGYSDDEADMYGGVLTTPDQIWRHTHARCLINGGVATLLDISQTGYSYRSSNIDRVEVVEGKLRIYIQSRANYLLDLDVELNKTAMLYGFRASVSLGAEGSSVWYFEVEFYKDVEFMLSMDTGSIANPPSATTSTLLPWLVPLVVDSLGANYYRVNHTVSTSFPSVTAFYTDTVLEADVKPVYVTSSNSKAAYIRTFAATGAKALCVIPNCLIPIEQLPDMQIKVSSILAAKKL